MVNYANPNQNVYAVSCVPANAEWGKGRLEKFLCSGGTPLKLWFTGPLASMWFYNRAGVAQTRVNLGVNMAASRDLEAVRRLYQRARPRSGKSLH